MDLPFLISAEVALWARDKATYGSYLNPLAEFTVDTLKFYYADPQEIHKAVWMLKEAGFWVTYIGKNNIGISGTPGLFETVFDLTLSAVEDGDSYKILAAMDSDTPATSFQANKCTLSKDDLLLSDLAARVVLDQPVILLDAGEYPPDGQIEEGQLHLYQIPEKLGDIPKRGETHPKSWSDAWPYLHTGSGVNIYISNDRFNANHPYFKKVYENNTVFLNSLIRQSSAYGASQDISIGLYNRRVEEIIEKIPDFFSEEDFKFDKQFLDKFYKFCYSEEEIKTIIEEGKIDKLKIPKTIKQKLDLNDIQSLFENFVANINNDHPDADLKEIWKMWFALFFAALIDLKMSNLKTAFYEKVYSHGTSVLSNILAVAPNPNIYSVFIDDFSPQKLQKTQIFTCSWIEPDDTKYITNKNKILEIIGNDFLVLFGASNKGQSESLHALYSSVYGYLSVGGCYFEGNELYAASSTHGYRKGNLYVPTLCGLSGRYQSKDDPYGKIWMPVDPKLLTPWEPMSGSSFATPQVAGLSARIIQVWPQASSQDIIEILKATATAVPKDNGSSSQGSPPPVATGAGLVNIWNALQLAKFCNRAITIYGEGDSTLKTASDVIKKLETLDSETADIPDKIRLEINGWDSDAHDHDPNKKKKLNFSTAWLNIFK